MISLFDLFKIGLGPSSSHTIGPMRAALAFREALISIGDAGKVARLGATLYGSLAWTGKGHASDKAVILGLSGLKPDGVDPDEADRVAAAAFAGAPFDLGGHPVAFEAARDIVFDVGVHKLKHPNTLAFAAYDAAGDLVLEQRWLSVGGGFILREGETQAAGEGGATKLPYPYRDGAQLLAQGQESGLSIAQMALANERALRPAAQVSAHVRGVREAMFACLARGLAREGQLPGGLQVKRRAAAIHRKLEEGRMRNARAAHEPMDYLSVFAMAVNEENAAGGRVVTAPTNGAAGVIPAVMRYYREFTPYANDSGLDVFLLTAGAIGAIFKMNASISGAEVGCQGEVGVASSMAAAGLCAALGGSNEQIENAAEIAMEHHLGMTCDPVGGLVQIPCIERNAFGAVKAVAAASLALHGDGLHRVSLDQVVATMRETGRDMSHKYKETSLGGLAVNWVEC
jgi:L-serine dehydratase